MQDNLFLFGLPILSGLAVSFLIESLLRPKVLPFWRRELSATAIHLGVWLLLFALIFLLLHFCTSIVSRAGK